MILRDIANFDYAAAVAFTHLVDGVEPRVNLVMRWPGQPAAAGRLDNFCSGFLVLMTAPQS